MTASTSGSNSSIDVNGLKNIIDSATKDVQAKLDKFKEMGSSLSIADMFDMQMCMNRLSQLSEMSTSVMSASNSAISSMARNVKS